MKRKTITLVASLLICISLIGVGFAAWVISAPAGDTAEGNVVAETVTDKRVSAVVKNNSSTIKFGTPETMNASNPWLTNDSIGTQSLTATFDVEVTPVDSGFTITNGLGEATGNVDLTATVNTSALNTKISADLVAGKTLANYVSVGTPSIELKSQNGSTLTYTVTVTFNWGSDFHGENPYNYFNELECDNDNATAAKAALQVLSKLNQEKFYINVTVTVA